MKSDERATGRCLGVLLLFLFLVGAAIPVGAADDLPLTEVLTRFDDVQNSIRTLRADFVETQINAMLKEPLVCEGQFYLTKPDFIRWEYSHPEKMRFVIASDQYVGYFPDQKRAEKRSIKRWSDKIFRFIGLGQASDELAKFYDIRIDNDPEHALENTYLLVLEPRKKRVRKRVEIVRFWLDESTFLPRKVEYLRNNGDSRIIDFTEIQMNPDLAAGIYSVELPDDVQVSKGFSGLPGISQGDYDEAN
jgi:outer membrane lipoprotein-sorting protein